MYKLLSHHVLTLAAKSTRLTFLCSTSRIESKEIMYFSGIINYEECVYVLHVHMFEGEVLFIIIDLTSDR